MKDRYTITEIRKQANRMTFGQVCSCTCTYVCISYSTIVCVNDGVYRYCH